MNFSHINAWILTQIDEWLEYAPILSTGSAFENACSYVDKYLERRTFLVSHSLSLADVAIWSGLAGIFFLIKKIKSSALSILFSRYHWSIVPQKLFLHHHAYLERGWERWVVMLCLFLFLKLFTVFLVY